MYTSYFICYFYVDKDGCQVWKNRLLDRAPISWLLDVQVKNGIDLILVSWQKLILKDEAQYKELSDEINNMEENRKKNEEAKG